MNYSNTCAFHLSLLKLHINERYLDFTINIMFKYLNSLLKSNHEIVFKMY